jgi:hypothetical protein
MKKEVTVILLAYAFVLVGCSRSSEGNRSPAGNTNQGNTVQTKLGGIAEVTLSTGNLIPADHEMIRLMKLPISDPDGKYYCRQLIVKPRSDDLRGIYVGVKDPEIIILGRFDQRPEVFNHYSYLTSPRGELSLYRVRSFRLARAIHPHQRRPWL